MHEIKLQLVNGQAGEKMFGQFDALLRSVSIKR